MRAHRVTRNILVLLGISAQVLYTSRSQANIPPGCSPSSVATLFVDVTGDLRADALVLNQGPSGIIVTVRRSDGSQLLANESWISDLPAPAIAFGAPPSFADVNGDGKADAISIVNENLVVYLSTGSSFLPGQVWSGGQPFSYSGLRRWYFADVNGDGMADSIAVTNTGVLVRRSTGNQFLSDSVWTANPYYGNAGTFFADVTGDGRADAIAYNESGSLPGYEYTTVRKSDGHEFLPNVTWQTTLVGNWGPWIVSDPAFSWPWDYKDVNGDGMADEIYVENQGVLVRLSTGSQLAARQPWTDIPYYGTVGTYFADVTGDHRADAVVVNMDGVTVRRSDGSQFRPNDPPWSSAYYGDFAPNCLQ